MKRASNANTSDIQADYCLHVQSDDVTHPLQVEGGEGIKFRLFQTACLCSCMIALGLISVVDGITLVHISLLYGTTPGKVSWNMMLQGIFCLLGTFMCRLLVGRTSFEVISSVCIIAASFFTSIAPFTPNLVAFIIIGAFRGLAVGCFVLSSQTFIIEAWSGHQYRDPLTQTQQAVWSVAAALSPFIIRPFLVELRRTQTDLMEQDGSTISAATLNGSMQHRFVTDGNVNLMFHNGLLNTTYYEARAAWTDLVNATWISSTDVTMITAAEPDLLPEGLLSVRYAYMLIGILSAVTSLPTVGLLLYTSMNSCGEHRAEPESQSGQFNENTSLKRARDVNSQYPVVTSISSRDDSMGHLAIAYLAVATGLSFFVGGSEIIGRSFLTPFAIRHLSWPVADATLLASTFFATFTFGRLLGILLSAKLRPMTMFVIDMSLVLAGFSLLLLLLVVSEFIPAIVWIGSSLIALGLSTGFPTLLLVNVAGLEESLRLEGESRVKSHVMQATITGTVIGSSVLVSVAGNLFDNASPMWIVYLPLISVLCIGLLLIARKTVFILL